MIWQERLRSLLYYDPITGWFTNRFERSRFASKGARAGSPSGHGYRKISIDGVKYYEHHLAWFYVHGYWPDELDHKDGNGSNNAFDNLREATRTENNFNRSMTEATTGRAGLRGAYWDSRTSNWYSKIQIGGQVIWLGTFPSAEEAHGAYKVAADLYVGEFALHNRKSHTANQEAM